MRKMEQILVVALLISSPTICQAEDNVPPPVEPNILLAPPNSFSYYRPVLNTNGNMVIFESNPITDADDTTLYIANLPMGNPQPFLPDLSASPASRPDWCWYRSGGSLTSGPVAFTIVNVPPSPDDGIYVVAGNGSSLFLLPNTAGMIYPSWYPDCKHIAVDVGTTHVTAEIDAATGKIIVSPLANDTVWAGFPSVNQADPKLISFAGQNNRESNYYDQDINYTWVTDRSTSPPTVAPMDREAPKGPGFLQKFQARAGWWSPDGKWFAFESNRICDDIDGATYAIFIQDAAGTRPAMQVTDCTKWNAQHPKWFPTGTTGGKTLLIAAVAKAGMNEPFAIASLDVSAFVGKH
jgi:WD40-like Beta Propeller Repeat